MDNKESHAAGKFAKLNEDNYKSWKNKMRFSFELKEAEYVQGDFSFWTTW